MEKKEDHSISHERKTNGMETNEWKPPLFFFLKIEIKALILGKKNTRVLPIFTLNA